MLIRLLNKALRPNHNKKFKQKILDTESRIWHFCIYENLSSDSNFTLLEDKISSVLYNKFMVMKLKSVTQLT